MKRISVLALLITMLLPSTSTDSAPIFSHVVVAQLGMQPMALAEDTSTNILVVAGQLPLEPVGGIVITAIDARTERIVSTSTQPGITLPTISTAIDGHTSRAFVAGRSDGNGPLLDVLSTVSGGLIRTVRTTGGRSLMRPGMSSSVHVGGVVVEGRTGHVFLLQALTRGEQQLNAITMLAGASGRLLHVQALRANDFPIAAVADAAHARVFVAVDGSDRVYMLDARDGRVMRSASVGKNPCAMAIDPGVHRLFVLNEVAPSSISVLDTATGKLLKTIPLGTAITENPPCPIAVDERRHRAFIPSAGAVQDGIPTGPGTLAVLDTRGLRIVRTVHVGVGPVAVAVDIATGHVFVVNFGNYRTHAQGSVSVLDGLTGAVIGTLSVPGNPNAVIVDARTHSAFLSLSTGATGGSRVAGALFVLHGY